MKKTTILAASAVALLGLGLTACSSTADAASGEASATCPDGKIRFGILPYEDPEALEPAYQVLA